MIPTPYHFIYQTFHHFRLLSPINPMFSIRRDGSEKISMNFRINIFTTQECVDRCQSDLPASLPLRIHASVHFSSARGLAGSAVSFNPVAQQKWNSINKLEDLFPQSGLEMRPGSDGHCDGCPWQGPEAGDVARPHIQISG